MERYGGNLNIYCFVKEVNPKRLYIAQTKKSQTEEAICQCGKCD